MGKVSSSPSGDTRATWVIALAVWLGLLLAIFGCDECWAAFAGANARIAYSLSDGSSDSIWSVSPDGSSPTRLTSGYDDANPVYSADGSRIAFERGGDIDVMIFNGSEVTRVLAEKSSETSTVEWRSGYETASGEIIPFVKITTVTSALRSFGDPAFSPDGSRLVAVLDTKDTVATRTCAVGVDEGQQCLADSDPDAYSEYGTTCTCLSQIVERSLGDGGGISALTAPEREIHFQTPSFSASGALAYAGASPSVPGSAIFVIRSPGALPSRITNGPKDYAPDFSPNGSRIVFSHGESDLGLVGVTGGLLTILPIANPPGSEGNLVETPVFSPDGLSIAYGRSVSLGGGATERGLYIVGAGGSNGVRVVDGGMAPSWQPGPLPASPRAVKWARAKARDGKLKLSRRHRVVIGRITCGDSSCRLALVASRVKVGKTVCRVKTFLARRLAPEKSTKVEVKVAGRCLAALRDDQVGSVMTDVKVVGQPKVQYLRLEARLSSQGK